MIEVTGKLLSSDYVAAQYLHLRPRLAFKILGSLIILAMLWAIWYTISKAGLSGLELMDYLFFGAIIYLLFFFIWFIPWKGRKIYRQQKSLQRESRHRFNDAGLEAENELGHATIPWTDYVKWKENDKIFLLYVSDPMFHMIPKRLFSDPRDVENLRGLLQTHIGKSAV